MTPVKKKVRDPDIEDILVHLGFIHEEPVMSCRKYKDKELRLYKVFNCVVDEKTKRSYSSHEIVMELLGCDADAAWAYLAKHDLM